MNLFSISDIENLTHIKAHTLRIWEQRYGLCGGKRKDSMHRYYDGEDLKQILRIAWLYHNGYKISHIAYLSPEEIKNKALGLTESAGSYDIYLNRLMESSIDLDTQTFEENFNEAISTFGFENTMIQIGFPFLMKLGMFWLTGHVIPAQEHFASAIITQKICVAIDQLPPVSSSANKRRVLLFTPVGEYHEIPLLFMRYLLKKNGVPHTYMGRALSNDLLASYCYHHPITEFYFHLITNLTHSDVNTYVQQLANTFIGQKIYCSGYSCQAIDNAPTNVQVLQSNEELLEFASY